MGGEPRHRYTNLHHSRSLGEGGGGLWASDQSDSHRTLLGPGQGSQALPPRPLTGAGCGGGPTLLSSHTTAPGSEPGCPALPHLAQTLALGFSCLYLEKSNSLLRVIPVSSRKPSGNALLGRLPLRPLTACPPHDGRVHRIFPASPLLGAKRDKGLHPVQKWGHQRGPCPRCVILFPRTSFQVGGAGSLCRRRRRGGGGGCLPGLRLGLASSAGSFA